MSKNKTEKVQIKESELVTLINNIVNEVVSTKKKEWIAEQKKSKTAILESRIAALEKKLHAKSK